MENSSKALIIAGAILVAILLISVGIMVMNSLNKPIEEVGLEGEVQEAQIHNAKFNAYIGSKKTSTEAKQAISLAKSSKISVYNAATGEDVINENDITLGTKYTIQADYEDGKISALRIYVPNN